MGGRVFRTRSSEELPGITTIAEWAMASGLGRVTGGQVRYGRPDPQLRLSDEREEAREPTAELSDSRSETHPDSIQTVPLGAIRCYLLDELYSTLTCTNGCSCWSPLRKYNPDLSL